MPASGKIDGVGAIGVGEQPGRAVGLVRARPDPRRQRAGAQRHDHRRGRPRRRAEGDSRRICAAATVRSPSAKVRLKDEAEDIADDRASLEDALRGILQPAAQHLHRDGAAGVGVQGDAELSRSAGQDVDQRPGLIPMIVTHLVQEFDDVCAKRAIRGGERALSGVDVESRVEGADPHQLVVIMLRKC